MRYTLAALGGIVVLGVLIDSAGLMIGDSRRHLAVQVRSASGKQIKKAYACATGDPERPEEQLQRWRITGKWSYFVDELEQQDPFTGDDLTVGVHITIRSSTLGFRNSYSQMPKLIVGVEYANGDRDGTIIELPSPLRQASLVVEIP